MEQKIINNFLDQYLRQNSNVVGVATHVENDEKIIHLCLEKEDQNVPKFLDIPGVGRLRVIYNVTGLITTY
jgi:hypothetical protein